MKAISFIAAVTVLLLASAALSVSAFNCNTFTSCQTCLSGEGLSLCGWCSQTASDGFQCSGLNPNGGKNNFTCNAVFSTETCKPGWTCNMSTYTCDMTAPGTGSTHEQCESNCTTTGKTFICNNQTSMCEIAPAGQGSSLEVCQQSCSATSAATHASNPTQPTHTEATATGSPHSNSPQSSEAPQPTTTTAVPLYKCDPATVQCVPAKVGEAGISSLTVCQQQCKKSNNTPADLVGLWRGFPISSQFSIEEYDYNFEATGDVQYTHTTGVVVSGKATFVEQSFSISFTDGSQQSCLYIQQATQPTTYEMIFACSNSATPPAGLNKAMTNSADFVLLAQRCVDPSICQFTLQAGPKKQQSSFFRGLAKKQKIAAETPSGINDQCQVYPNCTICVAQANCGWCSIPVQYQLANNQTVTGGQCAGFANDGHTPWVCNSMYTTGTCPITYVCNATTQQCVLGQPGDGNPSRAACEAGCKAKPGPPSQLNGKYRGILINENYQNEAGVFQINMNATSFSEILPDGTHLAGAIKHYAQYVFIDINGMGQIACIWSPNTATDGLVEYVTWACSRPGGVAPKGFTGSMNPKDGSEAIFAKCLSSNCKW